MEHMEHMGHINLEGCEIVGPERTDFGDVSILIPSRILAKGGTDMFSVCTENINITNRIARRVLGPNYQECVVLPGHGESIRSSPGIGYQFTVSENSDYISAVLLYTRQNTKGYAGPHGLLCFKSSEPEEAYGIIIPILHMVSMNILPGSMEDIQSFLKLK